MTSAWIQVDFNIFGDIKAKQNQMIEKQQKERGREKYSTRVSSWRDDSEEEEKSKNSERI